MAHSSNNSNNVSPSNNGSGNKPVKPASKSSSHQGFGTNMPMMSSAFDTAMWLTPA